jgi:hypothetical protein
MKISDIPSDQTDAALSAAKSEVAPKPPIRRGASKGVLAHVKCNPEVSEDESLLDAIEARRRRPDPPADRRSVAEVLSEMPNVGEDEDFARVQ